MSCRAACRATYCAACCATCCAACRAACLVLTITLFAPGFARAAALPSPLRGNNYVVVGNEPVLYLYPPLAMDSTVVTLWPAHYDAAAVENDFARMQALGYNGLRTFVAPNPPPPGGALRIDPIYLDNLVDFLRRARAHGLFVILAGGLVPPSYYDLVDEVRRPASPIYDPTYMAAKIEFPAGSGLIHTISKTLLAGGDNIIFIHKGLHYAEARYLLDVLDGISQRDPSLFADHAFALEPLNEPYLTSDQPPFSIRQGRLTITLGQKRTYNMDPADPANNRQQLADDMVLYWLERIGSPIKAAYPGLTLIASTFTPYSGGRSAVTGFCDANGGGYTGVIDYPYLPDKHQPLRIAALNESPWVDAISIHDSPLAIVEPVYHFDIDMMSAELDRLTLDKPLIMGEFWAYASFFPTIEEAAAALIAHQAHSVDYGFSGWMLWTWNWAQWNAQSAGGALATAMSPRFRPDPASGRDIRLLRPADGDAWRTGQTAEIEWMSNVATAGTGLKFELWRGGAKAADLGSDASAGGYGICQARVPSLPPGDYQLRAISLTDPNLSDATGETLAIVTSNAVSNWQAYP
ncbi:MAG: hypothetical protein M1457_09405 [bacterium]|nr:hypothetical protein [bacterium]